MTGNEFFMRPTVSSSLNRFRQRSTRLRHLTQELEQVQARIAGRLTAYHRECRDAEGLVHRAKALTARLQDVRAKLQLACDTRRMVREAPLPFGDPYEQGYLPGLGIHDDVESKPVAKLPEFTDHWDSLVDEAPPEYVCPITCMIMRYPVRTCDGHCYERRAIWEWFRSFDELPTSPLTNLPLPSLELVEDDALQREIQDWVEQRLPENVERMEVPGSPAAKAHHLSSTMVWHGYAAAPPPPPSSGKEVQTTRTPIWSSSIVPVDEPCAEELNALHALPADVPIPPQDVTPPAQPLSISRQGTPVRRTRSRSSNSAATLLSARPVAGLAVSALRPSRRSLNRRCVPR